MLQLLGGQRVEKLGKLQKTIRLDRSLMYVSAHTHAGHFIVHKEDPQQDNWLELNVGSILDWSLEFRTLEIGSDADVTAMIELTMRNSDLDKKIELLLALDRFERGCDVQDAEKLRKYRLSQAIWASKYDSVHSRTPLEEDWFLVFPPKQ
jgi:hypothetical protein